MRRMMPALSILLLLVPGLATAGGTGQIINHPKTITLQCETSPRHNPRSLDKIALGYGKAEIGCTDGHLRKTSFPMTGERKALLVSTSICVEHRCVIQNFWRGQPKPVMDPSACVPGAYAKCSKFNYTQRTFEVSPSSTKVVITLDNKKLIFWEN